MCRRVITGGGRSPIKRHEVLGGSIPAIGKGGVGQRKEEPKTEQTRVSGQGKNAITRKERKMKRSRILAILFLFTITAFAASGPNWIEFEPGMQWKAQAPINADSQVVSITTAAMPCYLIVLARGYQYDENLIAFYEWKNQKGFYAEGIIAPERPSVDWLHDVIEAWYSYWQDVPDYEPRYVLLVGDAPNRVGDEWEDYDPVKTGNDYCLPTHVYAHPVLGPYLPITSDYYYQLIDGDEYPDVAIGRWCVRNAQHIEAYVTKTFFYEQRFLSPGWKPHTALLVGHWNGWDPTPYKEGDGFIATKRYIDTHILPPKITNPDDINWPGYLRELQYGGGEGSGVPGAGGDNDGVKDAIQQDGGVGVVNYNGHGSPDSWIDWNTAGVSNFTTSDVERLDQSVFNGYPVVYNVCCWNGDITNPDVSSMVESWTRYKATGGAVAALGGSCPTKNNANLYFDSTLFKLQFLHLTPTPLDCGEAINLAKIMTMQEVQADPDPDHYPPGSDLITAYAYYWIGDPSLDVWRAIPHGAEITLHFKDQESILRVAVKVQPGDYPVPGATVCIYCKENGYHKIAYTDIGGGADFPLPIWQGVYQITATNQKGPICIHPAYYEYRVFCSPEPEVEETPGTTTDWKLEQISSIPVGSSVTISYSVGGPASSFVNLAIFDASGRQVRSLVSGDQTSGHYQITWDGRDASGSSCPSGVYFVSLRSQGFNATQRIVLVK
jgi:hypothetical protein